MGLVKPSAAIFWAHLHLLMTTNSTYEEVESLFRWAELGNWCGGWRWQPVFMFLYL